MFCAMCSAKIMGKPVKQGHEYFCSLECANLASGLDPEEAENYYEEDTFEDFFEEIE